MTGSIWVWAMGNNLIEIENPRTQPDEWRDDQFYLWDKDGKLYPHMKFGVDAFHTKREALINHRKHLTDSLRAWDRAASEFEEKYGEELNDL